MAVNSVPWPYLEVEPRKYRFHVLNAAVSRAFWFTLDNNMPFHVRVDAKAVMVRGLDWCPHGCVL